MGEKSSERRSVHLRTHLHTRTNTGPDFDTEDQWSRTGRGCTRITVLVVGVMIIIGFVASSRDAITSTVEHLRDNDGRHVRDYAHICCMQRSGTPRARWGRVYSPIVWERVLRSAVATFHDALFCIARCRGYISMVRHAQYVAEPIITFGLAPNSCGKWRAFYQSACVIFWQASIYAFFTRLRSMLQQV